MYSCPPADFLHSVSTPRFQGQQNLQEPQLTCIANNRSIFRPVNAVTKLVPPSGRTFLASTVSTAQVSTMEPPTSSSSA
ncbi:hypothetical protein GQ44DRAFT_703508 [Phaeosphaeriaceae sp. PMI808]|nr:hypothetical protein GQ44DRAFT_703508 [Phaeosphaeriaceae sp. PMI808]